MNPIATKENASYPLRVILWKGAGIPYLKSGFDSRRRTWWQVVNYKMKFLQKLIGSLFEISLVAGALLGICGCSELRLPLGNAAPPSPTVNPLPKYYQANPAMPEQPRVYGMVDVSYRLVDWNDLTSVQNGYSQKGYVPLGRCDFRAQTGVPLQVNAVDYARYLGADLVVYSVQNADNEGRSRHHIDFFAKTRMPARFKADRS
jgi:hypothetical protein